MANIVFDFLHNYETGERREPEPANAYQYDEGHVLEAILPEVITAAEIHYWIRGMETADAYVPTSITPNGDNSCTVLGNIPNKYFETNGELRVYIVVNDDTASITTYEGKLHICQRSMPDDYVDDDPENEATRILTEAQAAATTATQQAQAASDSAGQAQQSAETLSGSVAQITTNKNDISSLKEDFEAAIPTVEEQNTQTIAHTDFTAFGNKVVSAEGDFYDNSSYYSYIYQFDKSGKFYVNNFGNSSYGFIATYSGYPSKSTFITRNYNGTTPSEMGKIDVTAGQYVFVAVNMLSTIVFNTYLDYTANTRPILFRREMKIAWFGDSISQLQLLPHRVGSNIGCTVFDCSFAGSALTFGSTRYGGMSVYSLSGQIASGNFTDLETSLDNQEADHIDVTQKRINAATLEGLNFDTGVSHVVIMGGTNDLNNDYVTTSSDLTVFKGAVQDIIDNFNTNYPHIRLAFISDPYRGDITPTNPDKHGHSLIDINNAIQEVCEANNIVFYDLYHCCGINANTVGYYLMNDQLHQTEAGDILLAEKCAKWLEAN